MSIPLKSPPIKSPPIHRNRRSKPFEGFGYALYDAKGLRISQIEEEEEEENGDIDVVTGMEEE